MGTEQHRQPNDIGPRHAEPLHHRPGNKAADEPAHSQNDDQGSRHEGLETKASQTDGYKGKQQAIPQRHQRHGNDQAYDHTHPPTRRNGQGL